MAEIHVERKPRGRWLLWLVLLLVAVAGVAWLLMRRGEPAPVVAPGDTTAVSDSFQVVPPPVSPAPADTTAIGAPPGDTTAAIVGDDTTGQPDTAAPSDGRLGNP
jgi:hypothetical protein